MKLVIGLGNIGNKYENTRHNVGFMFVDFFLKQNNLTLKVDKKFDAAICKTRLFNQDVIFAQPQSFMNLSGRSVMMLSKFYNVDVKDILVIYDDLDQEFNKVKTKNSGSHGGHNGMRNIIDQLKTNQIPRLKIGIGRNKNMPTSNWVLSRFSKSEINELNSTFNDYETFIETFISESFEKACNGK